MILGHQEQWNFLKKSAEAGRVPHGFLFFGQDRLGKKKTALEFIKLLNCQSSESGKPCQGCFSCQSIDKLQHPDFFFIEPSEKNIQISQIRELSRKLFLRPFQSSFKAAILDQAHLMNHSAQTALLKTLEEPKGNTVLILISDRPEALLPTIISRVQKVRFQSVKKEEIKKFLSEKKLTNEEVEFISSASLGRPGIALNLLLSEENRENERRRLNSLAKILAPESDLAFRFQQIKKIVQDNQDSPRPGGISGLLEDWLRFFRKFLLVKIGAISNFEDSAELKNVSPKYSVFKIKEIIKSIQKAIFLLSTTNVNPRLALELIMLEL